MKKNKSISLLCLFLLTCINISLFSNDVLSLSWEDRRFLDELSPIKVLVDDNFIPISYYNDETEEFEGVAVEVLKGLSELLQFEYTILRDEKLSWQQRLDKIKSDEINILGGASRNSERQQYGVFTETPYFSTGYALIKLIEKHVYISELSDINKFRIGMSEGLSINNYIADFINNDAEVIYYKSQADALEALKRREIDLYPYNEAVFKEDFFAGMLFDYEIAYSIRDIKKDYAFFCPKTEDGLRLTAILDQGMKLMNIDKIIAERYQNRSNFAFYKEYHDEMQNRNTIQTIGIILLLMIAVGGSIVVFILKRESTQRGRLISQMEELQAQLENQASHDILTKLPNRLLFEDRLQQIIAASKRQNQKFAVMFMDLDGFKIINDTYGHETGDRILLETAARISSSMRESDTAARMGGDEFLAIISDIPDKNHPAIIARRILKMISEPIEIDGNFHAVSISIGISIYPEDSTDAAKLTALADKAMYAIKKSGKNSFRFTSA